MMGERRKEARREGESAGDPKQRSKTSVEKSRLIITSSVSHGENKGRTRILCLSPDVLEVVDRVHHLMVRRV